MFCCGPFLLLTVTSWVWLGSSFIYGEAHVSRPIPLFLLAYLLSWGLFSISAIIIFRGTSISVWFVLGVALLLRLVLIFGNPIQEADFYRYTLDGNLLIREFNPYQFSPLELQQAPPPVLEEALREDGAEQVLSRVSYPEISTVYPPVAQVLFGMGAQISGWHWVGQRLVFSSLEVACLLLVLSLLQRLCFSSRWLLLYAWNPLVLKEIINSVHLDIAVLFFLLLSLLLLRQNENRRSILGDVLLAGTLSGAILSKLYPLLLMPTFFFYFWRKNRAGRGIAIMLLTGCLGFLAYLPFRSAGAGNLISGLAKYSVDWQMNEGVFSILNWVLAEPRFIAGGLITVAAFIIPILRKANTVTGLIGDLTWVLILWFLLIPTPFPWYAVPLIGLLAFCPGRALFPVLLTLTGALGLYYFNFYFEYQDLPRVYWDVTRLIEHGLIWLSLAFGLLWLSNIRLRRKTRWNRR